MKKKSTKILDGIVSRQGAKSQRNFRRRWTQIDTDLETKKLKCKTQNQNSKIKTNDRF